MVQQIREISAHPHDYDVYICKRNFFPWKVVMSAPKGSPYEGGTFLLTVEFEKTFPILPPQVRFVTRIHHPNFNKHGKVCHSILNRNWTSDMNMQEVLGLVYSLLLAAEFSDPMDTLSTPAYHHDKADFRAEIETYITRCALKTREE